MGGGSQATETSTALACVACKKKALPGVVAMGKGLGSLENGEFVSWDSLVTC